MAFTGGSTKSTGDVITAALTIGIAYGIIDLIIESRLK